MKRQDDGSVVIGPQEAAAVAKVLSLGRSLCEDLEAPSPTFPGGVETELLEMINQLEELGVSADELTGKLDQRPRSS